MNTFYVYILCCADNSYYVGHTDNIEQRLQDHDTGTFGGYTAIRRPLKLVYLQEWQTRDEAFAQEQRLKGWSRAKKEALMQGQWDKLVLLSKNSILRQAQDERGASNFAQATSDKKPGCVG